MCYCIICHRSYSVIYYIIFYHTTLDCYNPSSTIQWCIAELYTIILHPYISPAVLIILHHYIICIIWSVYTYYHQIIWCTLVTHMSHSLIHTCVHTLIAAMQGADMLIRGDTALPVQQPTVFLSPAIHTHSRTDGTAIGSNLGVQYFAQGHLDVQSIQRPSA